MYLSRLIYYSKNNVVNTADQSAFKQIKSILDQSSTHNRERGITGALLFNQAYFAQVLEGDRKAITETFCHISRDKRHSDIVLLSANPITERIFADWTMAFAGKSDGASELYIRFGITQDFNPRKMTSESLLAFICELIKIDEHVAKFPAEKSS
ncbi:MAG: BLUF domain-containing protein [Cohaesibacter sp.]|jgi:hypothetical protein|nr:BLUF domain-containing protein [Cohaesibacter sp.]